MLHTNQQVQCKQQGTVNLINKEQGFGHKLHNCTEENKIIFEYIDKHVELLYKTTFQGILQINLKDKL